MIAVIYGIALLASAIIGSILWPYAINTWLALAGKAMTCTAWNGFFIGLIPVVGGWSIPAAIITWLVLLFI